MSSSTINTKQVTGRRVVRYESFDEILADAERLAVVPTRTLGNWSIGQIFSHLAKSSDVLIVARPIGSSRLTGELLDIPHSESAQPTIGMRGIFATANFT